MLKLIYTENCFYLEHLALSLEEWVEQRVILALRVGQLVDFEHSTGSFLLPVELPGVERLKAEVQQHDAKVMELSVCDAEYLEVTLQGSWLSDSSENAVGVFVTMMSDRTKFFLRKLWQEAQLCASVVSD